MLYEGACYIMLHVVKSDLTTGSIPYSGLEDRKQKTALQGRKSET